MLAVAGCQLLGPPGQMVGRRSLRDLGPPYSLDRWPAWFVLAGWEETAH